MKTWLRKADLTKEDASKLSDEQKAVQAVQKAVKAEAQKATGTTTEVVFIDMGITKTVTVSGATDGTTTTVYSTGSNVLEIVVPFKTAGKYNIGVYRRHVDENGRVTLTTLTELKDRPTADYRDGTFYVGDTYIVIYATKFSTYAIGYTETPETTPVPTPGGSGGGSTAATYPVNTTDVPGGAVNSDKEKAAKDGKVTLTITPDKGYETDKVTVTDKDGKIIPVTKNADGTYSFQMPDSPVNVSVSFKEAAKQPASPEETGVADWLVTDDHIVYFSGYEDSTVKPEGNITRAEVAMIFYRLLKNQDVEITASFPDVKDGDWFAQAVTTLASLKIITGYEDGTFAPGKQISRAEFTAIATRFAKAVNGTVNFSDVTADHWAADNIATGSEYGWINGYEDNTFRPSKPITRAEVAAIVNRMLARAADEAYVGANRDQLVQFSDLQDTSKWYYLDMVEATNEHDFTKTDGVENWK